MCDSDTAFFQVPQEKLDKLQQLLRAAVDGGRLSCRTLQWIPGKCMGMTVAIRPAWIWTQAMFTVIAELQKPGRCTVDLTHNSCAGLLGESRLWLGITATSQEGPRQRARYCSATLTNG